MSDLLYILCEFYLNQAVIPFPPKQRWEHPANCPIEEHIPRVLRCHLRLFLIKWQSTMKEDWGLLADAGSPFQGLVLGKTQHLFEYCLYTQYIHLRMTNGFRIAFTYSFNPSRNGYPEQCHRKSNDLVQQGGLAVREHERGWRYCNCHQWKGERDEIVDGAGLSGLLWRVGYSHLPWNLDM